MKFYSLYSNCRSFRQRIFDIAEPKKYAILLTLVLLINTVILIVIAKNKTSNKINELSIQNENNLYEYESSDLFYGQLLPDYPYDISNGQPRTELDDSTPETTHMNSHYTSSEPTHKAAMVPDENNHSQADY